ncbi:tetratricopeptide repeat protein [Streptomyces sp. ISL-94]|uniref:CHAT domain-containing tetratricopeptide repeat protein n=1 Tax=Streptomyces sp. ISL-94 TaxID=2819190 RepID=UPI001BE51376|nr:tetratricopeptide repeat protein [Streptomyces sp. ISL-94]MBT2482474.1 tetratricopeptide repeat protein [Streptomyces sp. ISL-94]
MQLTWPLDTQSLDDLCWYLEEYLRAPFGVYSDRGPQIAGQLPGWGAQVFEAIFGTGPARDAYMRAWTRAGSGSLEIVLRSESAQLLGLPWEVMADPGHPKPIALGWAAMTRSLPTAKLGEVFTVEGSRLRVLMVISRPRGEADVGYQMIARPLLRRLEAVRGNVDLVVLRPPTLERLGEVLHEAREAGEPFQIVHFDGHGAFGEPAEPESNWGPSTFQGPGPRGMLEFEQPAGGSDLVPAERVAQVLGQARVPVVVLNACQSAMVGSQVEAAVATRLLQEGARAVVAMAYSVYAVAAAEFMTAFYERLFAGDRVADAVAAGRRRLAQHDQRPSPKGLLPLDDWMVPVLYYRSEVSFPGLRTERKAGESTEAILDRISKQPNDGNDGTASPDERLTSDGEFVGRDGLLYSLDVAARLQRVVVLHGSAGIGKTELAKAFGRWCRDTGAVDATDSVIWHSFEPGLASFGLDGVINSIGLRMFGTRFALLQNRTQRETAVKEVLKHRRLLLIWDNFECVYTMPDPTRATPALSEEERGALRGFLNHITRNGKSAVIITSRTPETWLGEVRRIEVPGLEPEEANQYAEEILAPYSRGRQRRAQKAFGELMQWLEGNPLCMRLMLPHLDTREPQDLLDVLQGAVPMPENESDILSASVAYSFAHVPAADQQTLAALSLLHGAADAKVLGTFSQDAVAPGRFRGHTAEDWQQLLRRAAGIGLLTELGDDIYRIPPALPAFLAARWRNEEPKGYRDQHQAASLALLNAYAALSERLKYRLSAGDAQSAIAVIDTQRRTLGSLLGYALDHAMWEQAKQIVELLDTYWKVRGLFIEAGLWLGRARLALENSNGAPPCLDSAAGALWLIVVESEASQQVRAHQLSQAENTYQDILQALQEQPPSNEQRSHLATTYHGLGRVGQERGWLNEAEQWYQQSLAIRRDLRDRPGIASSYHQLGIVAHVRGQLDEAEQWYRQSLAIRKDLRDRPGIASSYHQLGIVAHVRGQLDEAEQWHQRSLAVKENLRDRPGMASSYHELGMVAQFCRRLDKAERRYLQALAIEEDLRDRPGMVLTYHQLGRVAQERGRLDEAEQWYRQSLAIAEDLRDRPGIASSYHQLGIVAQLQGRLGKAERRYRQSLAIRKDLRDQPGIASSYHQLGRVAQERGRLDKAERRYRQSLAIKEGLPDRPGMAFSYGQLGLLSEERGDPREALEWMVRCVACFEEFPHPATGPGPELLKRMVSSLGLEALEESWQAVTGEPVPPSVRDYVQGDP